jgi:hypothetical protein
VEPSPLLLRTLLAYCTSPVDGWVWSNKWNTWQRSRSTQRKPASMLLCPTQIPHGMTRAQTQTAAVRSRRLTAWATARQKLQLDCEAMYQDTNSIPIGMENWYTVVAINTSVLNKTKKTPWSESASELYRQSDRRLSAKWLPTSADRGCHVVSVTDPSGRILGFLDRSRYFSIK